jgi:diketogulonate reductase-like aldo/keto reductase
MKNNILNHIELNNKIKMPVLGLGTFPLNKFKLMKVVFQAYTLGYRSFDTSSAYNNEKWLGLSLLLLRFFKKKEKIFITTKLSNSDQRKGNVRQALLDSMKRLNMKSIDLYLMHWPNPETYMDSWKQMEMLYQEGLVKAIGVCNFHQHHLDELLKIAKIVPVINQVELHPLLSQLELAEYCKSREISIEAYSPVARMHPKLIKNKILTKIAGKYNKSVPQIILRWDIQHGYVVIPKSSSYNRLKENISIFDFELLPEEMALIDGINENFRIRHNPDTADFNKL